MKICTGQIQQISFEDVNMKTISSNEEGIDFQAMILQMMSMMGITRENQNILTEEIPIGSDLPTSELSSMEFSTIEAENFKNQMSSFILSMTNENIQDENKNLFHGMVKSTENPINRDVLQELLQQMINMENNNQNNQEEISTQKSIEEPLQKLLPQLEKTSIFSKQDEKISKVESEGEKVLPEEIPLKVRDNDKSIFTLPQSNNVENPGNIEKNLTRAIEIDPKPKEALERPEEKTDSKTSLFIHQEASFSKMLEQKIHNPQSPVEIKNMQDILNQMGTEIKELKEGETSFLQVKLKPKELGEMEIKLEMKAGELIGKILVENLNAKGILDSQVQYIKDTLKNQNIFIQEIEVNLQSNTQEQHQQRGQAYLSQDKRGSNQKESNQKDEWAGVKSLENETPIHSYHYRRKGNSLNLLA